ncbi:MAG: V-type ATP synthase subunit E, partial [Thermoplasmata archaeon]
AKAEARNILAKTMADIEKEKNARIQEEKQKLDFELKQEVYAAKVRAKNMELRAKQEILEGLKAEILNRLNKMDLEKKRELLGKMLKIAKKTIPEGAIYASASDEQILRGFAVYPVKGIINARGGFIVEEKGGEKLLDLRYETLLEHIFEKYGEEIYHRLFD